MDQQINLARSWLDKAFLLDKDKNPDFWALGTSSFQISHQSLDYLERIRQHLPDHGDKKDIISIAVDDMKVISGLMKLVVVFGIYPSLPHNAMLPLQERVPNWRLPSKSPNSFESFEELQWLSTRLTDILINGNDLSNLLLVSPFMPDILTVVSQSDNPGEFEKLTSIIPTSNLYRYLIQIRGLPHVSPIVSQTLSKIVLTRKNAVQTLIELIIETDEGIVNPPNMSKVAVALSTIPNGIDGRKYARQLGQQLFTLLSSELKTLDNPNSTPQLEAAVMIVNDLAKIKPKLLGTLRDLLLTPFTKPNILISESANALMRLLCVSPTVPHPFSTYLASRVKVSVWLLWTSALVFSAAEARQEKPDDVAPSDLTTSIDKFIVKLTCLLLDLDPRNAHNMVKDLLVARTPNGLSWHLSQGQQPALVEHFGLGHGRSLLSQIELRVTAFVLLMRKVEDTTASSVLVVLMQMWMSPNPTDSPLTRLLAAKSIEQLTQDEYVRKKLFNSPTEIYRFAYSVINKRAPTIVPTLSANVSSKLDQLTLGDSDDEDADVDSGESSDDASKVDKVRRESRQRTGSDFKEDVVILEIALDLLGNVLIELTTQDDLKLTAAEQEQLRLIKNDENLPQTVRARADFCIEILDGGSRLKQEVNSEDDQQTLEVAETALKEPLVPSRAYGIHLMAKLLEKKYISLEKAMGAYIESLQDDDSYVYLNAIKAIEAAAKVQPTVRIVETLLPLLKNDQVGQLDVNLRVREALVRVLTSVSMASVNTDLIDLLINDLKAYAKGEVDIRIRISSCSLLSMIIAQFPLSIPAHEQDTAADCALGIITYERADSDVALIRAASVLALEIINASNSGEFQNVNPKTLKSLLITVESVIPTTNDEILLDLYQAVVAASTIKA